MFNNKKDPLVDAVKSVIQKSEQDRQIERLLNESLGIESKKALPHEYHAQYDAMLNEAKALSPKQERLAKLGTVTGKGGHPEDIDPADLKAAREGHAHKVGLEEDEHLDEASLAARQAVVARAEKIAAQKRKALGPDVDPSSLETKAGKEFTSAMGRAATARSGLERRMKPGFGKNVVKEGITSAVHKFMSKRAGAKADHAFDMGDEKEFAKQTDKAEAHRVKAGGKPTKINTDPKSKFLTKESEQLDEKAVSKAQHRFFGLVRAIQKGKAEGSAKAEKAAEEMSVKQVRDYAKTKEKGLPEKIDESLESIHEEIRNTLWEKLDYVYENYGEDAAMEMYASLTEEEQSILQLNELGEFLNKFFGPPAAQQARIDAGQDPIKGTPSTVPHIPSPAIKYDAEKEKSLAHLPGAQRERIKAGQNPITGNPNPGYNDEISTAGRQESPAAQPAVPAAAPAKPAPSVPAATPKPTPRSAPSSSGGAYSGPFSDRPEWVKKAFNPDTGA